jgi:chemotaxis methyl-accepting protein methylase
MTKNCERNNVKDIVIFRLNLNEFHHFTNKYDIILCSEILRPSPLSFQ